MRTFPAFVLILFALFVFPQHGNSAESFPDFKSLQEQDKQLIVLLKARKHEELDARLEGLLKRYAQDPSIEAVVDRAWDTFYRSDPELETLFTEWITKRPKSASAYLARGAHYTRMGWVKRGSQVFDQTTRQQVEGMAYNFGKALQDFERALKLNNRLLHALCYQIEILMNTPARAERVALRDRALEINPLSLTARWYYITTVLPRWGGSHPEVAKEIEAARPFYAKNPALRVLEGRIASDVADHAMSSGDSTQAVALYSEALQHGNYHHYLAQRGEAYSHLRQTPLAIKDLGAAIELRPNSPRARYVRGFELHRSGQLAAAILDLTEVVESNPFDHRSWRIRGDAYLRLGKAELALADFEKAVGLDPNNKQYRADVELAKTALAAKR